MSAPFGEPLLTDSRLQAIEDQIRQDFPQLPEYCTFVTWVQEPQWARVRGIDVQLPMTAVLAILVTNYRNRDSFRIFQKGETMDRWTQRNWNVRHDSGVHADPAYVALKELVPDILEWDSNLKAMN